MSGGVGMEERDQMKKQANQYDLQLSFAARSGDYVAVKSHHAYIVSH
jgi:hypothetical protein